MRAFLKYLKIPADVVITGVLWCYFLLVYVLVFAPACLGACVFSGNPRAAFQKYNHRFFKGFIWLLKKIVPGLRIQIDERIAGLHSTVVVCNHRSYLDPVLMIALFEKQSTIVKSNFFRVPIFGRVIRAAGYIPSQGASGSAALLFKRLDSMTDFLADGGVLFVFPEGTRSRDGRIGPFNKGAFKIARRCNTPIDVLTIRHTDKLFTPGRFLFNTCVPNRIEVRWVGRIAPAAGTGKFEINRVMEEAGALMAADLTPNPRIPEQESSYNERVSAV